MGTNVASALPPVLHGEGFPAPDLETSNDWNRRLQDRLRTLAFSPSKNESDYRIGPNDILDINIFEAPEMNREVRVSAGGEISLPLLETVDVSGLTPRELETLLEERLHQKYMKDPHVGVFVRDVESHPVSVMGAVRKPGVYQLRGSKTLLELLSMAEGLADDAGDTVLILRGAALGSPQPTPPGPVEDESNPSLHSVAKVNLKELLDSTDARNNPEVCPGDIVKVSRAGVVYVVGAVRRPGGFTLKSNEKISVLQAIALSEGLTPTASHGGARIIRTDELGTQKEMPCDLGKVLAGKAPDPVLGSRDILFVPDSATKSTLSRSLEAALQTLTGLLIFHW